jgi:hypothetical protein
MVHSSAVVIGLGSAFGRRGAGIAAVGSSGRICMACNHRNQALMLA